MWRGYSKAAPSLPRPFLRPSNPREQPIGRAHLEWRGQRALSRGSPWSPARKALSMRSGRNAPADMCRSRRPSSTLTGQGMPGPRPSCGPRLRTVFFMSQARSDQTVASWSPGEPMTPVSAVISSWRPDMKRKRPPGVRRSSSVPAGRAMPAIRSQPPIWKERFWLPGDSTEPGVGP